MFSHCKPTFTTPVYTHICEHNSSPCFVLVRDYEYYTGNVVIKWRAEVRKTFTVYDLICLFFLLNLETHFICFFYD